MPSTTLLSIHSLCVNVQNKPVLKDINLQLQRGEIHAIIGPNGAGKSTLSHVLVGKASYEVTQGSVLFAGEDLLAMPPEVRANKGVFMAFQHPVAIPGVSNLHFFQTAINEQRRAKALNPLPLPACITLIKTAMATIGLDAAFLHRSVNDDFSGGEKKRNELLQILLLKPALVILDETDSGLDLEARRYMKKIIQQMQQAQHSFMIITHYAELFQDITPNKVHIMQKGSIVASGDATLATKVLTEGYDACTP